MQYHRQFHIGDAIICYVTDNIPGQPLSLHSLTLTHMPSAHCSAYSYINMCKSRCSKAVTAYLFLKDIYRVLLVKRKWLNNFAQTTCADPSIYVIHWSHSTYI